MFVEPNRFCDFEQILMTTMETTTFVVYTNKLVNELVAPTCFVFMIAIIFLIKYIHPTTSGYILFILSLVCIEQASNNRIIKMPSFSHKKLLPL